MILAIGVIVGFLGFLLMTWDNRNKFAFPLVAVGLVLILTSSAFAQHVHPDEIITDKQVAEFYEKWKRPPSRIVSCCSSQDCYAAPIRKGANGGLEYFHKWTQRWASIPPAVLEHNQPDPHDSPNHEAHVCAAPYSPDLVFCAVLGSGT